MNLPFDVIIIGAGVTGAATARELSRYDLRTAVLEKETDVSFGTSKANSGIIHPGFHATPGTLKACLAPLGNRAFDRLKEELEFPFERRGSLLVAFTEDELFSLQHYFLQGKKNNVPYMELLSRERTLEAEPNLNPDILGALHAPTTGIICPYEYCFALIENAVRNGVELFTQQEVTRITKKAKKGFIVKTRKGAEFSTRFIVNAAGLYADDIAALVGITDFKILPRKGEEYLLDRRVGNLVKKVIFPLPTATSKGMLVIPTVDGPVMVGPTARDIKRKDDFSTTREGLKTVFEHARKMVPSIRSSDIITAFVGIRPVATGGDFIIGKTRVKGFINAAGIQSPGLTASPAVAEMIKNILVKEGLRLEINPSFNPKRKCIARARKFIEKRDFNKLEHAIKHNKDYASLVCRCENITEAEVVDAIRKGHTTLDALKFMTRIGTGRCQGGFCTSRVLDIIHRETGIPVEKITKKGPGSEIVPFLLKKGEKIG
ncbi:MAG: NAD(P)/FAD-dependent oxidoreductase [Candidatus Omnitrophota bacterium]